MFVYLSKMKNLMKNVIESLSKLDMSDISKCILSHISTKYIVRAAVRTVYNSSGSRVRKK